jgi:hypothetical protein
VIFASLPVVFAVHVRLTSTCSNSLQEVDVSAGALLRYSPYREEVSQFLLELKGWN